MSKDLGWAEWTYETIVFRDDCTVLKGYFVPSEKGCWVCSDFDETLVTEGNEYRIIYTTLPLSRNPLTTFKEEIKVYFEERFEPIFSTRGNIHLTSHDLNFTVPVINRKASISFEELLPAYENYIDTLISKDKYSLAAHLLNRYTGKARLICYSKAKKKIRKRILSKYRVRNFFLNASPEEGDIISLFESIYHWLDFKGDDKILRQLDEISLLQSNIKFNLKSKDLLDVFQWCDSLITKVQRFGKYNKCYENALSLYRKALVTDGQTLKVSELDLEIIDVCRHIYDIDEDKYLEHLFSISSDTSRLFPNLLSKSEIICGINIWKEVCDNAKIYNPNSWRYVSALMRIANYNYYNRHFDTALKQYLYIDSLSKSNYDKWNIGLTLEIFSLSQSIGSCYYQKGDLSNAIKYDKDNPFYRYFSGDIDTLMSLVEKSYKNSIIGLNGIVKHPIIVSPGSYYDGGIFESSYMPVLTEQIPYFAYKTKYSVLSEMVYNSALITKEFRLSAEIELQQYLKMTQDTISMKFNAQMANEMLIYQSMLKENDIGALEKRQEIIALQTKHVTYLNSIGVFNKIRYPNWKEVRSALNEHELAIEFIKFPLWNQDLSMYAALILRKDSEYPKLVALFDEMQLKQVPDTTYYQCDEMSKLIWEPLKAELLGVKDVYFSPSGVLHSIGIEYLPGMEDYNIYRLSSTRELVTKTESKPMHRAVLYGGLDYDAKLDTLSKNNSVVSLDTTFKERADVRGMGLRGSKEYLEHTKIEVDTIGAELKNAKWECLLDTAALGTEESFKALSGRNIGYLHISTHGFYYTKEEAEDARYQFMLSDEHLGSVEDKALTRSGLILSGANHILEWKPIPDNVEDGILTAREIADVDLRGLDLVVLSACQTGLGDISGGEGVFGLQRGFKKAGAKSILMSLWEVDDEATQILMTQFNRNLLSGQTKRQSLISAQKYLREYGNGKYNNPKYWAAFILLDAF